MLQGHQVLLLQLLVGPTAAAQREVPWEVQPGLGLSGPANQGQQQQVQQQVVLQVLLQQEQEQQRCPGGLAFWGLCLVSETASVLAARSARYRLQLGWQDTGSYSSKIARQQLQLLAVYQLSAAAAATEQFC